jgi:LexA DNA binding domain
MSTTKESAQLTPRQRELYQYMLCYQRGFGRPPTMIEMSVHMHTRQSCGVVRHIAELRRKGLVKEVAPDWTPRRYLAVAAPK